MKNIVLVILGIISIVLLLGSLVVGELYGEVVEDILRLCGWIFLLAFIVLKFMIKNKR
ncbi:MAG TPA: hypothetical protein IAC14_11425 [Candidatus Scybalomonas excrementigallinarum]|jgi:hypothetical protein|nr:hypothetical protein [Candidatus Scybalomonas excrementigallinarum]